MTLRHQLFWGIGLIFFLLFGGLVIQSVNASRDYLRQQINAQVQDVAAELANDLATPLSQNDQEQINARVDTVFKRGEFRRIEISTYQGGPVITRELASRVDDVPAWFVGMINVKNPRGDAIVSLGEQGYGRVTVVNQPAYAYRHLWRSTQEIGSLLGGAFLLSLVLVHLFLRRILEPLQQVESAAKAICDKRFELIERIPRAQELKRVVFAMNGAARLISSLLDAEAERTEGHRRESFTDAVTGLENRRSFNLQLARALGEDLPAQGAMLAVLEIDGLREFNLSQGHAAGDALLKNIAVEAHARLAGEQAILARIGGASFAFFSPDESREQALEGLNALLAHLDETWRGEERSLRFQAGLAMCLPGEQPGAALGRADLALEKARQGGGGHCEILAEDLPAGSPQGSTAWRTLLDEALAAKRWTLLAQPVVGHRGSVMHFEITSRLLNREGQTLSPEHFIPMAQRHQLMAALDKAVVQQVLQQVSDPGHAPRSFAINLSRQAIADREFLEWLETRLMTLGELAERVDFEVSEITCQRAPEDVLRLRALLRARGSRLGMDQFGFTPSSTTNLRTILPDYIKLDGALTRELALDADVRQVLKGIVQIAHSLETLVIAQKVENEETAALLLEEGTDGGQGYHYGRPEALQSL